MLCKPTEGFPKEFVQYLEYCDSLGLRSFQSFAEKPGPACF